MHQPKQILNHGAAGHVSPTRRDPWWVQWGLIAATVGIITLLIVVPVAYVFYGALADGLPAYWSNLADDSDTLHAIGLTLFVALIAVLGNVVFGVAAAWAIARFRFPGKTLLTASLDLPFSVSPVIAGLMLLLLFGMQGYWGPWLGSHGIEIVFATPGLILATAFVTLPFVVRELLPVMETIGPEEEIAAVSLGARPWQLFWRVTLPNVKWGLLYGVILCNARAMGEFGAVQMVSGQIPGRTQTMPLRIERLYQEFGKMPAAFAVASLLTALALVTLLVKATLERKTRRDLAEAASLAPTNQGDAK